jgi:hypothetical protein
MHRPVVRFATLAAAAGALACAPPALATWSIVIADRNTREVAVGTVTCLEQFDLLAIVPVVVVGKGAGACQSFGDFDGQRRPVIFDGLVNGDSPLAILNQVAVIGGHQGRQYGIADTLGRTVTFTGTQCAQWAGGVTGEIGTLVYAIQGNILTGQCVVDAIRDALANTIGDIPEKLMAGMEAARDAGGDGRCSCFAGPTACGCPVPSFLKSGHIGGMIVARSGDTDDPECAASGCADGKYYMRLNVTFQTFAYPDPVDQLRSQFNAWRAGLRGKPDHLRSRVTFDPPTIPADGISRTTMRIDLRDWRDVRAFRPARVLNVTHAEGSAGQATIGRVESTDGNVFTVRLTAGRQPGVDRFEVRLDESPNPIVLMPTPRLTYTPLGSAAWDGASAPPTDSAATPAD